MTVRRIAALAAALLAAPLASLAQQGAARDAGANARAAPAKVPAVPQAAAATLAPAAPRPSAPKDPAPATPAAGKPAPAKHGAPAAPPAKAWRAKGRTSSGVAPGVLARAATRNQKERAPAVPPGCELPPEKRDPKTSCPPAAGQIESIEMDWNAPVR